MNLGARVLKPANFVEPTNLDLVACLQRNGRRSILAFLVANNVGMSELRDWDWAFILRGEGPRHELGPVLVVVPALVSRIRHAVGDDLANVAVA